MGRGVNKKFLFTPARENLIYKTKEKQMFLNENYYSRVPIFRAQMTEIKTSRFEPASSAYKVFYLHI